MSIGSGGELAPPELASSLSGFRRRLPRTKTRDPSVDWLGSRIFSSQSIELIYGAELKVYHHMSHFMRKPVFWVSDKV